MFFYYLILLTYLLFGYWIWIWICGRLLLGLFGCRCAWWDCLFGFVFLLWLIGFAFDTFVLFGYVTVLVVARVRVVIVYCSFGFVALIV